MELMTKEIEKKLKETGYYPEVDDLLDATVIVKYFNPCGGATWLIVGGEQDGPNWILFGYATLDGCDWEWGQYSYTIYKGIKDSWALALKEICTVKTKKYEI